MAVPALRSLFVLGLLLALVLPASACFGPKLYLGVPAGTEGEVLAELVSLYVKEKTGVESVLVPLEGNDPVAEVVAERLDLAIVAAPSERLAVLLELAGGPLLLAGPRPLEDLQFTTVAPALRKLDGLLDRALLDGLVRDVAGGEPPRARVRRLLMERAWI